MHPVQLNRRFRLTKIKHKDGTCLFVVVDHVKCKLKSAVIDTNCDREQIQSQDLKLSGDKLRRADN